MCARDYIIKLENSIYQTEYALVQFVPNFKIVVVLESYSTCVRETLHNKIWKLYVNGWTISLLFIFSHILPFPLFPYLFFVCLLIHSIHGGVFRSPLPWHMLEKIPHFSLYMVTIFLCCCCTVATSTDSATLLVLVWIRTNRITVARTVICGSSVTTPFSATSSWNGIVMMMMMMTRAATTHRLWSRRKCRSLLLIGNRGWRTRMITFYFLGIRLCERWGFYYVRNLFPGTFRTLFTVDTIFWFSSSSMKQPV